jgi:hypothetical protein
MGRLAFFELQIILKTGSHLPQVVELSLFLLCPRSFGNHRSGEGIDDQVIGVRQKLRYFDVH